MKKEIKELKRIIVHLNEELDSYNKELYKCKHVMVKMRSRVTALTHICYSPASPESLDLDFDN